VRSGSDYKLTDGLEVLAFVGMVVLTYVGPLLGGVFWYSRTHDPRVFDAILLVGPPLVLSLIVLTSQLFRWTRRGRTLAAGDEPVSPLGIALAGVFSAGLLILLAVLLGIVG
jgi:hypothetical protein